MKWYLQRFYVLWGDLWLSNTVISLIKKYRKLTENLERRENLMLAVHSDKIEWSVSNDSFQHDFECELISQFPHIPDWLH